MRLITQNLNSHLLWREKKQQFLTVVRDLDPDILCIQELASRQEEHPRLFTNEATEIEQELGLKGFCSASDKGTPNQGIFTKQSSVTVYRNHLFSFSGILDNGEIDKHRRYLIAQELTIKSHHFLLINLHLSVNKNFRFKNWEETMLWLNTTGFIDRNVMIVGDFNSYDTPDIEEEIENSGFTNAWRTLRKDTCVTYYSARWWLKNYPDMPESRGIKKNNKDYPENCLDFIFYRGNLKPITIDYVDLVPQVSDHKGLVFDFEIAK